MSELNFYTNILIEIKDRIKTAQSKAILSANAEMINMYWDIGEIIYFRQQKEGWGAGVIPKLANDLKNEIPDVKGFSERNIGRMIAFYKEYSREDEILPQSVAKLENRKQTVSQLNKEGV